MPENIAIISSKFGFDRYIHEGIISMMSKNENGQTDRQTAFHLYSVKIY